MLSTQGGEKRAEQACGRELGRYRERCRPLGLLSVCRYYIRVQYSAMGNDGLRSVGRMRGGRFLAAPSAATRGIS